jgi:hypothetical protein
MVEPLRHRQTKGAETDMLDLTPPRHVSTLPTPAVGCAQIALPPDGSCERVKSTVSERAPGPMIIRWLKTRPPPKTPYLIASFRDWRRFTKFPALDSADTLSSLPPEAPRLLAHHQDDAAS